MIIRSRLVKNTHKRYLCVRPSVHPGLKSTAASFAIFTLTVTLVAYTATALTMAISADQSIVALANIYMTITFVFMMVRRSRAHKWISSTVVAVVVAAAEEEASVCVVFLDLLGSPGELTQHEGLAGLAAVL